MAENNNQPRPQNQGGQGQKNGNYQNRNRSYQNRNRSNKSGRPQQGAQGASSGEEPLSALSALAAFLNTIREGAVGTAVTDLYLCFELQSTTTALMTLAPAWCIVTDTASYYVNCITGAVSLA